MTWSNKADELLIDYIESSGSDRGIVDYVAGLEAKLAEAEKRAKDNRKAFAILHDHLAWLYAVCDEPPMLGSVLRERLVASAMVKAVIKRHDAVVAAAKRCAAVGSCLCGLNTSEEKSQCPICDLRDALAKVGD